MSRIARRAVIAALAALLCVSTDARSQPPERPLLLPTRDVAVIYRVDGIGMEGAHKLQVTFTKAGDRTRIDYFRWVEAKYPFLSLIFDRSADRITVVMPERRAYMERPIGTNANPAAFLRSDMRFTRKGKATVADNACTEWKVRPADKPEDLGTACITDEGLLLSLTPEKSSDASMTATVVGYVSPPDGVFVPPAEFTREPAR